MGRTVDDRVVSMAFENNKFEQGVSKTLSSLDKLKNALNFKDAGRGLQGITTAANRTDLSNISNNVEQIKNKFSALNAAATAVIFNITNRLVNAGGQFIKAFTFEPVIAGLREYENQLNSVQTILSNTKSAGTSLGDVNKALNQLNEYADKTIYNFGQMTKNIGTFTAAGVDLKTSVASIKGISNLAALSGSNAEQASTAMYQLSQAISSGRVSLQDWNSVVNAGMGGTVFQRALTQTAVAMGKLDDGAVKLTGKMKNVSIEGKSFRESIMAKPGETSWLTSDVLTNTLKQFSGDLSKAELKAQGFNDAQIKAIQAQAKMALEAATQVKTFSQLLDTTKEALGSGWAQTWQIIFGDFGEAKTLFTGLADAIGGFVKNSAEARNAVLKDWKDLGGRTLLIKSLKDAFGALGDILDPIKKAFRDIFPKKTGQDLFNLTMKFHEFTETLKPGPETVENLRRTFRGFFAILSIGKQIIGGIFSVIGDLFGVVGEGSGGFLNLTGNIGDFLVSIDESLKKGKVLEKFFDRLGEIISSPVRALGELSNIWNEFFGGIGTSGGMAQSVLAGIGNAFNSLGNVIAEALSTMDLDAVFKVLEVGLLAGVAVLAKKILSGGIGNALTGGLLKSVIGAFDGIGEASGAVSGTLNSLTGSLKAMQQNVKSDTLKNIAIAIALLAASIIGLSFVDEKRLNTALTAITLAFAQLLGAMAIMDKIGKSGGFIKMPVIAASMVVLAGAINLLAIAVFGLSRLSWEELAKGLGAITVLLGALSAAAIPLSANAAGMMRAGTGIAIIAVAMNILARAVRSFGDMDMATLAKGIGGIAVALAGIGTAAKLFPSGMVVIGVGLIAIGAALKLMAGTIERLGGLDMATLAKGIGGIAAALVGIGLAMKLMPLTLPITAAGLVLVGLALKSIAKSVGSFGGMSLGEIAKGLGALAGSLAILVVALHAMSGTLMGAAALTVVSGAIALLAPALKSLGDQSWGSIIKGMVALAAAFGILAAASVILAPAVPAILAFGVALVAIGAGLALAGAGVALIGVGLGAVAVAGPAAVKILVDALVQLATALPQVVQGLVKALVELVQSVAEAAPQFVKAVGEILELMATAIIIAAPQIGKAFVAVITMALKVLRDKFPDLVRTGMQMLISLLKGIRDNISQAVKMAVDIVTNMLEAIASKIPQIIESGAKILAGIIKGIAGGLRTVVRAGVDVIVSFLRGIGDNIKRIVTAGGNLIIKLIEGVASNFQKLVNTGVKIIVNLLDGIGNAGPRLITAGTNAATKFISALSKGFTKLVDEGGKAILEILRGIRTGVEKYTPQITSEAIGIGVALVEGVLKGIADKASAIPGSIKRHITDKIPGGIKKLLGMRSPSRVMAELGRNIVEGLTIGMEDSSRNAVAASNNIVKSIVDSISNIPNVIDISPTVTPVLDLTNLEKDAQAMGSMFNVIPISAARSYEQASTISSDQTAVAGSEETVTGQAPNIKFEQNNYSPESLSEVEIYRMTRNQLSQARAIIAPT